MEKQKVYTLIIYNTLTQKDETVEVTLSVYNEFRRSYWREEKNNSKHEYNEIPVSALIGNEDGSGDRFSEFATNAANLEDTIIKSEIMRLLEQAMTNLSDDERALINALYYRRLSEQAYAEEIGVVQKTINNRRHKILTKIKNYLES